MWPGDAADLQIVEDGEVREDAPTLGRVADTAANDKRGLQILEVGAVELDAAAGVVRHAHDGLERARLAGAIGADPRHRLTRLEPQGAAVAADDGPVGDP